MVKPLTWGAAEYKSARQQRGTQQGVAASLGVALSTVQRREAGDWEITEEARLAILSIPLRKAKRGTHRPNAAISDGTNEKSI